MVWEDLSGGGIYQVSRKLLAIGDYEHCHIHIRTDHPRAVEKSAPRRDVPGPRENSPRNNYP